MNKLQTKNFDVAGDAQADFTFKLNAISPKVELEIKCIVDVIPVVTGTGNCTDTCDSIGKECGSHTMCGETEDCGTCDSGFTCNQGICKETPEEPGDSWFWIIIIGLMVPIIALIIIVVIIILKEKKRGFSKKEIKPNQGPPKPGPMNRPPYQPQNQPRNLNFPGRGS